MDQNLQSVSDSQTKWLSAWPVLGQQKSEYKVNIVHCLEVVERALELITFNIFTLIYFFF